MCSWGQANRCEPGWCSWGQANRCDDADEPEDEPTSPKMTSLARVAKPNMVMRSIRVPLTLWTDAKAKADERGENISDVLRAALETYVKEQP